MPGGVTNERATNELMNSYQKWGYQFIFEFGHLNTDISDLVNRLIENGVTYNWEHILELLARAILNDIHGSPLEWETLPINEKSMICSELAAFILQQANVKAPEDPRLKGYSPEGFVNKGNRARACAMFKYDKPSGIPFPTPNNDEADYSPNELRNLRQLNFKQLKEYMIDRKLNAVFLCDWAQNKHPVDALIHVVTKSWANHVAILYRNKQGEFYFTQSEMGNTAQQVEKIEGIFKQLPARLLALAKEKNLSDKLKQKGVLKTINHFIDNIKHDDLDKNKLKEYAEQGFNEGTSNISKESQPILSIRNIPGKAPLLFSVAALVMVDSYYLDTASVIRPILVVVVVVAGAFATKCCSKTKYPTLWSLPSHNSAYTEKDPQDNKETSHHYIV